MRKVLRNIILIVLILIIVFAGYNIAKILIEQYRADQTFTELKDDGYPFDKYDEMIGWIVVPGTDIDYPVMHTPDEPEKYLRLDINGEYSSCGTPFMDYRCTLDSANVIIYGHHMFSGAMFAPLAKYEDAEFLKENGTFEFTSRDNKTYVYEIFAVLKLDVTKDMDVYDFTDGDESQLKQYVKLLKEKQLYDTGINPENRQIMCLSTCSYHTDEGRLVVAGALKGVKKK